MIIKVEAIIREEKLQDVLDALGEMEVHGLTCYQVMGCGTQRGMKSKLEVLVSSEEWEKKTMETIQKAAYTGNIGDGKIFSYDVRDAMRIRTKETGPGAIQPE